MVENSEAPGKARTSRSSSLPCPLTLKNFCEPIDVPGLPLNGRGRVHLKAIACKSRSRHAARGDLQA
jgi:hypothetical protein